MSTRAIQPTAAPRPMPRVKRGAAVAGLLACGAALGVAELLQRA
jgi:hypothetical protein